MANAKFILKFVIVIIILNHTCKITHISREENICNIRERKVLRKCYENNLTYTYLKNQRVEISYSDGENNIRLKGWIRAKYDSCILMAISPAFGIEIARIFITKDSIYVLNRINKEAYITDFERINEKFHILINLSTIENLLFARIPIELKESNNEEKVGTCNEKTNMYKVKYRYEEKEYKYFIDSNYRLRFFELRDDINNTIYTIEYVRNKMNVSDIIIIAKTDNKYIHINISLGKNSIDEKQKIVFEVPENYTIKKWK